MALAGDVALVGLLVPAEALAHPVVQLAKDLLPVFLGGALIAYFDGFRKLVLRWGKLLGVRVMAWALLPVLAVVQLPVLPVPLRITPPQATLLVGGVPADPGDQRGAVSLRLPSTPGPAYPLVVRGEAHDPGGLVEEYVDSVELTKWQTLWATITRRPLEVTAPGKIIVMIGPEVQTRTWWIEAEAQLPTLSRGRLARRYAHRERGGRFLFWVNLAQGAQGKPIKLPAGTYRVTLASHECRTLPISDLVLSPMTTLTLGFDLMLQYSPCPR
jgi:hypothetical protein